MQLRRDEVRPSRWRRGCRCAALVAAACATPAVPAYAEQTMQATYHSFSDSEKNHIDTWVVEYAHAVSEAWHASVRGLLDRVHLPPLPGLPGSRENVDAITAASRPVQSVTQSKLDYLKERYELTSSAEWAPRGRTTRAGGSYYVSRESDYLAQQVAGEMSRSWAGGSRSLAVRSSYGFDRIHPAAHLDGDTAVESRKSLDGTVTATQTLSTKSQLQGGFELTTVHGFQSNPYRQVYAGGQKVPERHPSERFRRSVFTELDHYFSTRASAAVGARYYDDDWGVRAGTFDAHFNQYVGDHFIVRYRYRYHTQSAAYFYRDLYAEQDGIDGFRTADYKLQNFDSNLFGVKVTVPFEGLTRWSNGLVLDVKYERYFDSNSFAANVLEAGFSWPF